MKRNTLPLFNLAWHPVFFWDGRAASLEEQVFHPVRDYNEMNLDWHEAARRLKQSRPYRKRFRAAFGRAQIDSVLVARAVAQFLRTLISNRSKYDRVMEGMAFFTKDEFDGFNLVNDQTRGDCIHCHSTDGDGLGTRLVFSNNGLDAAVNPQEYADPGRGAVTGQPADNGKFMVPSLRNLAFTAPYMHDGRFRTLEEVIDFYSDGVQRGVNTDAKMEYAHQGGVNLTSDEKKKVLAFLLTLSDSAFIADPAFGNPFSGE
jgi:cytochrome c peroxidase